MNLQWLIDTLSLPDTDPKTVKIVSEYLYSRLQGMEYSAELHDTMDMSGKHYSISGISTVNAHFTFLANPSPNLDESTTSVRSPHVEKDVNAVLDKMDKREKPNRFGFLCYDSDL